MNKKDKIYIAGHTGLVGSALMRQLTSTGYTNLLTRSHKELDLTRQAPVEAFFAAERPAYVFLAAARVGGILANSTFPAEFIYQNLTIETNIIHAAWKNNVKRLLFLGSSCIYPRDCPQPMKESHLLTGPLEPTNEPYALAKIAGIELCRSYNRQYHTRFFCVMPTNLYGPHDNFDLETSHVLPALIRKFHAAKSNATSGVTIWGTGAPRREFLHVDDMAGACIFLMERDKNTIIKLTEDPKPPLLNIGWGKDLTIRELAMVIKDIVGYKGKIQFDPTRPDGTPQKLLNTSKISELGWRAQISLKKGIAQTYEWCLKNNVFQGP